SAVIALGATITLIAALYQPFDGFGIVVQGILRGVQKTTTLTAILLGSGFAVFIPLVWFLGEYESMGVVGAWTAAIVHVVLVAVLLGIAVRRSEVFRGVKLIRLR
ncbi:MAG: hypothetical protein FWD57_02215, partial [Polyangiaceae bacterium]|nr:hypothetical protein [Polyangiaceae bacterium]